MGKCGRDTKGIEGCSSSGNNEKSPENPPVRGNTPGPQPPLKKKKKKRKKGEVVPMTFNLKQSCRFINQVDLIEKKGSYLVFDLAENFDND